MYITYECLSVSQLLWEPAPGLPPPKKSTPMVLTDTKQVTHKETWTVDATEEHCLVESFQPRCPKNDVILMTSAIYGRMRIGRCITAEEVAAHGSAAQEDRRYFGCSADVLPMLDRKCSGKTNCDVRVYDISQQNTGPCLPGLNVYLETSYNCISGN